MIDPQSADQEAGAVTASDAGLVPNTQSALAPPEAVPSTTSSSFPHIGIASTATPQTHPTSGRVSPPAVSSQSQTAAPVTNDSLPPAHTSHETAASQMAPTVSVPASSSSISASVVQTSVPAAPVPQLSANTAPVPASEPQPFNNAAMSSQPMNSAKKLKMKNL